MMDKSGAEAKLAKLSQEHMLLETIKKKENLVASGNQNGPDAAVMGSRRSSPHDTQVTQKL